MSELADLKKELAETKRKLVDKEVLFENILEGTLAGYFDWHITTNYEYLSPTFKSMFGYADHEMENSPDSWQKIIHPDDLPGVFETFGKHVASRGAIPYDSEVRYYHKDGSIVWVYCRGKIIEWDEEGNPLRMVGSHVDITKLKEAENTEKYARELEKKNRELEQFAYVASHDLQEPLRTVNSFVELFKREYKDNLDETGQDYLRFIEQGSTRMSTLVRDLLDYSRLGRNKELGEADCDKLVKNVEADLSKVIKETGAQIKTDKLPVVKGYVTELRLLFQNLISNALKFSKPGTAPEIHISAEDKPGQYVFRIKDNGIGIAEEHSERIFTIFQRLHNKTEFEGTGIGLAQCRKIMDSHNGDIRVESKLGEGSTFYFTLPK